MKKISHIVLPAIMLLSPATQASDLFIEGGLHFGGDEIARPIGSDTSVDAGQLLSGTIGLNTAINEELELRTSIGLKFDLVTSGDADMIFTRLPINAMIFAKGEKVSFGVGATYHLGPRFKSSGFINDLTIDFDDAFGFIAEIDIRLGEKGYIGLQAVAIDYEFDLGFGPAEIDGNSVGIVLGARF